MGCKQVIVIGGGAAGMMAAYAAAERGHSVTLVEANEKLGKKLYITGKGRCNLTNACPMDEMFAKVMSNRKFLYSAFDACTNEWVMEFFRHYGVPLKTERGGRVFPVSDHSSDIIAALSRALKDKHVKVMLNTRVEGLHCVSCYADDIQKLKPDTEYVDSDAQMATRCSDVQPEMQHADDQAEDEAESDTNKKMKSREVDGSCKKDRTESESSHVDGIVLSGGRVLHADHVILATGGVSYPATGSTGDGYRFAESCGHRLVTPSPSLVPMNAKEAWVRSLQGLSLRNVAIRITKGKKTLYEDFGEMLFTHFGVSGPMILSASSAIAPKHFSGELLLQIDLKPALSEQELDQRVIRDFDEQHGKEFGNALGKLFPASLAPVMAELSGIDVHKRAGEVTRQERQEFVRLIKHLPITVTGLRSFQEAIITKGGISVKDVDPSTMRSKCVEGLSVCGEVLDLDAQTGGYNLQIAWSTGYLAGISI